MPDDAPPPTTTPVPQGGSPSALRRANIDRVLTELSQGGPATQSALAAATGLSPASISNLVGELRRDGRVTTSPTTANGRRAVLVSPTPTTSGRLLVGLDLGRRHVRCVLVAPDGAVHADEQADLPAGSDVRTSLDGARGVLDAALAAAGASREEVAAAGVAVPAPLDRRTGTIGHVELLPGFDGLDLARTFEQALDLPVVVDNDANLGALGEHRWGGHPTPGALVYVKVASGIGSGIVLDGRLHRGAVGMAGEIGHLPVGPYGEVCRCGNRGCVETVASIPAILGAVGRPLGRPVRTGELLALVHDGDTAALRVLEDAALALGRVLGAVCNMLDPGTVVVGGPLHRAGPAFLDPLTHGIRRATNPTVGETTSVVLSRLGDPAEALGAAALALGAATRPGGPTGGSPGDPSVPGS